MILQLNTFLSGHPPSPSKKYYSLHFIKLFIYLETILTDTDNLE